MQILTGRAVLGGGVRCWFLLESSRVRPPGSPANMERVLAQQRIVSLQKAGASGVAADLCSRGWRREGAKGPGGLWRSDQGDLCLEAGGAARARADAGQHGHLRAARDAVAASPRVLGFGAPAQDALQMPTPPLPS